MRSLHIVSPPGSLRVADFPLAKTAGEYRTTFVRTAPARRSRTEREAASTTASPRRVGVSWRRRGGVAGQATGCGCVAGVSRARCSLFLLQPTRVATGRVWSVSGPFEAHSRRRPERFHLSFGVLILQAGSRTVARARHGLRVTSVPLRAVIHRSASRAPGRRARSSAQGLRSVEAQASRYRRRSPADSNTLTADRCFGARRCSGLTA